MWWAKQKQYLSFLERLGLYCDGKARLKVFVEGYDAPLEGFPSKLTNEYLELTDNSVAVLIKVAKIEIVSANLAKEGRNTTQWFKD